MSIEIRNLSITSSVVQRQAQPDERPQQTDDDARDAGAPLAGDWRAECRRMILELLELHRER